MDRLTDALDDDVLSYTGSDALITAFMSDEIMTAEPDTTLHQAAVLLDNAGSGFMVVGHHGAVEGVVSERDILRAVARGIDLDAVTVADIESRDLRWATPDSSVGEVLEEMMGGYIRHVLVGDKSGLIGVVSMRDVLAAYLD